MDDVLSTEVDEGAEDLDGESADELAGEGGEFVAFEEVVEVEGEKLECHVLN